MSAGRAAALTASGLALALLTGLGLLFQSSDRLDAFLAVAGLQCAAYGAAVWAGWRGPSSGRAVLGILALALVLRGAVLCAPPYLSTDVYRYVWDGRVQAAGINPYRYRPVDPLLAPLRDTEIFPNINRAGTAVTIYPPAAEAIFLLVTRIADGVTAMRTAMVGFEAVACLLLLRLLAVERLPASRLVVYAWHPLPLWEFAGSGHVDAALITCAVAALWTARRGDPALSAVCLALATLTKFLPAVLFPAVWRRRDRLAPAVFAVVVALAYVPYLSVGWGVLGFLPQYKVEEGFDLGGSGFYLLGLLRRLPGLAGLAVAVYLALAGAMLASLAAAIALARRPPRSPGASAALLATAFIVVLSPHYPWYFAWLIPFACVVRSLSLLWLTNACLLLYLVPVRSLIVRDDYRVAIESMIYVPFAILAAFDLWSHRRERSQGVPNAAQPA